jgi:hypothetical protein
MHMIAMPPPPSADGCFALAFVYGVLASGVCWIAVRRRRSVPHAHRFIAWIPAAACIGSIAAILAGPIALSEGSMDHWIGYNVEFAFMRSFLGASSAAFISSVLLAVTESRFQNSRSSMVAVVFAAVICAAGFFAVFLQSAYVSFFVVVHIAVLVAANCIYIRRFIQRPAHSATSQHGHSSSPPHPGPLPRDAAF